MEGGDIYIPEFECSFLDLLPTASQLPQLLLLSVRAKRVESSLPSADIEDSMEYSDRSLPQGRERSLCLAIEKDDQELRETEEAENDPKNIVHRRSTPLTDFPSFLRRPAGVINNAEVLISALIIASGSLTDNYSGTFNGATLTTLRTRTSYISFDPLLKCVYGGERESTGSLFKYSRSL